MLVFEHPRTKKVGDRNVDIYSSHYVENKTINGEKVVILSKTENGVIEKSDLFNRISVDLVDILRKFFSSTFSHFISNAHIDRVSGYIVNELAEVELDKKEVSILLKAALAEYFITYWMYRLFFILATRSKELVIVDSYSSKAGMIAAAKKSGLYVKELQHGVITKYHLGYSYEGKKSNDLFIPDQILVWSGFWKDIVSKLSPVRSVDVLANDFVSAAVVKYKKQDKEENNLVIISQGAISEALASFLIKYSSFFKRYQVFYKLHPSEVKNWRKNDSILNVSKMSNVEIVEDGDLYDYISTANIVLGVFSTAMFEAMEIGCQVVVLPLPGSEYMDGMPGFITFDEWCRQHEKIGEDHRYE